MSDYEIPLTQGQVAKVSPHRIAELSRFKWYARWSKRQKSFYAVRSVHAPQSRTVLMHRQILGLTDPKTKGDHINGDSLDNRDENLRPCTQGQNTMNSQKMRRSKCPYKGVRILGRRFQARVKVNGAFIYLGMFDTAEDAYAAYCEGAKKYHGEFARLT